MRLVVTGSRGLIGRHVVDYAKTQAGVEVIGVDQVYPGDWRANYRFADMTDLGQVYSALAGADAVIHLAAIRDHGLVPEPKLFLDNVTTPITSWKPRAGLASSGWSCRRACR